jgi:hypothetical protein
LTYSTIPSFVAFYSVSREAVFGILPAKSTSHRMAALNRRAAADG